MTITKRISYSDVGNGFIHVANVTTNNPTIISASFALITSFSSSSENPSISGTLKFDPSSGNDRSYAFSISESTNKDYLMQISGNSSVYTEVGGEILVEVHRIGGDTPAPTAGEFILIVEVNSLAIS